MGRNMKIMKFGTESIETDDIKHLVTIMDDADLSALKVSINGAQIELERSRGTLSQAQLPLMADKVSNLIAEKESSNEASAANVNTEDDVVIVRSPTVGAFYISPSPEEDPFALPGQEVLSGQTLAVVEAMKMMNEITAPVPGIITEVLAANGTNVEYDQPLFRISTSSLN